jgi:hypothetical protein
MKDILASHPDVKLQVSITVDPLDLDDLKREHISIPIVRQMESQNFGSAADAERYLSTLLEGGLSGRTLADRIASPRMLTMTSLIASFKILP